jgi:hypothetical protein
LLIPTSMRKLRQVIEHGDRQTCWAEACERNWFKGEKAYLFLAVELPRVAYERVRARTSVKYFATMRGDGYE